MTHWQLKFIFCFRIVGTKNIDWREVLERYSNLVDAEAKATLRLLEKDSNLNGFLTDDKFKDFFCQMTNERYVAISVELLKTHILLNFLHTFEIKW